MCEKWLMMKIYGTIGRQIIYLNLRLRSKFSIILLLLFLTKLPIYGKLEEKSLKETHSSENILDKNKSFFSVILCLWCLITENKRDS